MSEEYEETDIRDILYDPENNDPIMMQDQDGNDVMFEQIALFPIDGTEYVLLRPVDHIEGMEEDELLVFRLVEEDDSASLEIVTDRNLAEKVFDEFLKLVEEEGEDEGGEEE